VRLTLSSKKDCYYFTSEKGCNVQGWHLWPDLQALEGSKPRGQIMEQHDKNLYKMPASYRRMVRMTREEN